MGNAITLTAGLATIQVLEHSNVYSYIDGFGDKVREGLDAVFERNNFEAQTTGIGSLFAIHSTVEKPLKDANCQLLENHNQSRKMFSYLLDNGIFMLLPELLHGALSYSHTDEDIERLLLTIERHVKDIR